MSLRTANITPVALVYVIDEEVEINVPVNRNRNRNQYLCSYCREPGHTIHNCNHPHIQMYDEHAKQLANTAILHHNENILKNWLGLQGPNTLRAISMRYGLDSLHYNKPRLLAGFMLIYLYDPPNITRENNVFVISNEDETRRLYWEEIGLRGLPVAFVDQTIQQYGLVNFRESIERRNARDINNDQNISIRDIIHLPQNRIDEIIINFANHRPHHSDKKFSITTMMSCIEDQTGLDTAFECPICYTESKQFDGVSTNCNHDFCGSCIKTYLHTMQTVHTKEPDCPMCRSKLSVLTIKNVELFNEIDNTYCLPSR